MFRWKLSPLVSAFLVFSTICYAQTAATAPDPEKEKAKKELDEKIVQMLDQVIGDASYLRLPQNKAIVLAMAGNLYWKFDEKRSRDLFRSAAAELLAYNADIEREKRESTEQGYMEFPDPNDPRGQVLPLIARSDAELALEILVQTRPAALAEAMLRASAPDARADGGMFGYNPDTQRVRQEIALEQNFALLAADENPDRAIKMIKDSLSKGVSRSVYPLLMRLHKKDEKKASELAGEVIRKLIDTDLSRKNDELNTSINFLQAFTSEISGQDPDTKGKPFKFTEAQIKDLAAKLVTTFMQPSNSVTITMVMTRAMPLLEKLVPDKASALRQRMADSQRSLPAEMRNMQRMERLWDQSSTPEQILAEIPKMQNEMERSSAYQAAASKISQIDDEARAKRLIEQIGDEKARSRANDAFESAKISRMASAGKLEEARKMIGSLTNKRIQIQKLVGLAMVFHKKGSDADIEAAKSLMKNARGLINETPEDEDEMNSLMEVVKGYAVIDPQSAFRLFEPLVDQINDIVHASAILSKYNKRNRSFKKGELILRTNPTFGDGVLLFRYLDQIRLLGKADLASMGSLSDRFQRSDARAIVKLIAIQGSLTDDKKAEPGGFTGSFYMEY